VALVPGRRLGHYEIVSPLGAGGMGEVYKARDVRLGRSVAIKVLPAELAESAERLRRFEVEARTASGLNHPNIVALYDIGVEGPLSFLAMELVEGRTLSEVLIDGPLPIRKLLDYSVQIAEAMAAAHEAGVVHRDLKPGNLMISRDGFVKLLDFGLARREGPVAEVDDASKIATTPGTLPGAVLGTVGYMSPEQARGAAVDYRSDQFSFGAIVYEMATGARAFVRGTAVETLTAILKEEPEPIAKRRPEIPGPLRWMIERCLGKSPADRYRSTSDLALELRGIRDHLSELSGERVTAGFRPSKKRRTIALAAAAALLLGLGGLWLGLSGWLRRPAAPVLKRLTFRNGSVARALFVPRSNSILYTASWDGKPSASYLTLPESKGIDRKLDAPVQLPMAYTADGSEVLVLLGRSLTALNAFGALAWWPALGGKPRPALEQAGWSDWAPRGRFLAAVRVRGGERVLEILNADGKSERTLFRTVGAISWVRISPDEKRIAFIHHPSRFDNAGEVRVVSVDGSAGLPPGSRFETCTGLAWNARTGEIWFTATSDSVYSTSLWAAAPGKTARRIYSFPDVLILQDAAGSECLLVGGSEETRLILWRQNQKALNLSWLGSTYVTDFSHDRKNVLFIDGTAEEKTLGTWLRPLDGGEATRVADGEVGRFSPDDQSIATTTRSGSGTPQVVLVTLATGRSVPITSSAAPNSWPSFAGADTILFSRAQAGKTEIWRTGIDGKGERRLAVGCDRPAANPESSAFLCIGGTQDDVLYVAPITPAGEARLQTVRELAGGEKFIYARWNASGREIYAVTNNGRMLTLDPATGNMVRDEPVPLDEDAARSILGAVFSDDAAVQAYSVGRKTSNLYLFRGL
jgi:serine/threonine protein kinase